MLERALIAELEAQLVKIDIDSTMHTGRARNLVKPPLDGTELEIAGSIVEHTPVRSEEHTSELQSLMRISYAVFCLKKKNTAQQQNTRHTHQSPTHTNTNT